MASTFINAHDQVIGSFLQRDIRISVPEHQRDYAWGDDQVLQLLDDIKTAMADESDHFIGPFVLKEIEKDRDYQILDGQQRFTTTLILLAVIRDIFDELKDSQMVQNI